MRKFLTVQSAFHNFRKFLIAQSAFHNFTSNLCLSYDNNTVVNKNVNFASK